MLRSCLSAVLLSATLLVTSGCGTPPNKEMDMAQGAIDAARAAGAEQYATTEYTAATTSLKNAHDAVAAGDYRLALNHALSSHERAQNAARDTANSKAAKRAGAERTLLELEMFLGQADTRLATAQRARVPQRQLTASAKTVATIRADVQKAREAVDAGDYLAAEKELEGMRARIDEVVTAIAGSTPAQPARRRR
jgi:hypothetical protein